jgi:formylglycine-generating enzyme required for sulfatase activity
MQSHIRVTFVCCVLTATLVSPVRAEDAVIHDSTGTTLRLIPAGRFEMGTGDTAAVFGKDHSDFNEQDDRPIHPVVLTKPFYLAATEVTVGQFRQFVDETKHVTSAEKNQLGIVGWDPTPPKNNPKFVATFQQKPEFTWRNPGFEQDDSHPVVGVSFGDAKAYCGWLSKKENVAYRLPTEAEWENAARAGTSTMFSFGDAYRGTIHRHANLGNVELEKAFPDRVRRQWLVDVERDPSDRHVFTAPVGSYEPNPWKLHDLAGNVWEWCEDRYLDTFYAQFDRPGYQQVRKRAIDPLNTEKWNDAGDWRVIRGGSWFNAPIQCRSSCRGYFDATDAACFVGFRVARNASTAAIDESKRQFEQSEAARTALDRLAGGLRENRDGRLTLRLRKDQFTDEIASLLKQLDDPIDIHLDGQYKLEGQDIACVASAKNLCGLLVSNAGTKVTDADFASVAGRDLEQFQANEATTLTDALFAHLENQKRLEFLSVNGEKITDVGLDRLPALPRLKSLFLNNTKATGALLAKLSGAPLEGLSFSNFTDDNSVHLARFPLIHNIRLSGSPITGRTLAEIAKIPRLTSLDLDRCGELNDDDFRPLAKCYNLQRVGLEKTAAGDAAATALAQLNNLGDVRMGGEHLSDAGMQKLCEIVSLRSLTMNSDATSITDSGLRDLWRLRNLEYLDLNPPRMTGAGLTALQELPALRSFSSSSPVMTDAGLRAIARCTALEQLSIGGWQTDGPVGVTDDGLGWLAQMKSLKQFQFFRKNTKTTDAGIETLTSKHGLNLTVR